MTLITEEAGADSVEFVIFGSDGQGDFDPPKEFAEIPHINVSSVGQAKRIFDSIRKCDLVYDIGGGDSFADIYGWKRLIKVAGLKLLAAFAGRSPVMSPQTIGPFESLPSKALGKIAIKACRSVFARDEMSFERANALMGGARASRLANACDVAFSLKRLTDWPEKFPALDRSQRQVGINVSGLLYNGGYTGDNQFGLALNYKELVHELLEELSARDQTQVWLIPHVFNIHHATVECDRAASIALCNAFPRVQIAPIFRDAREAKTFIGSMDLMLAARMHAAIAAVSSGVACIPMSYSVKFEGLFRSIGYPFTMELKSIEPDGAKALVLDALDNTDALAAQACTARDRALEMLSSYRTHLREEIGCKTAQH